MTKRGKSVPTRIAIFQQRGSGCKKIEGIGRYGRDIEIVLNWNITEVLPEFIDEPEEYLPDHIDADLVLSFLSHPDLLDHLAGLCTRLCIPIIASGKKNDRAITPPTCCGLGRLPGLGAYGDQFGIPELRVTIREGKIATIEILRGASCGATWEAAATVIGLDPETAASTLAREVQYRCVADPSGFDPVSGKSLLHYAGDVHAKALRRACRTAMTTDGHR